MTDTTTIHADRNSGILHFQVSEKFAAYLVAGLLAANLISTVVLYQAYRSFEQTQDLRRYDLDFFKQNDWATIKAQVETDHQLIQAYGLQKVVKEK